MNSRIFIIILLVSFLFVIVSPLFTPVKVDKDTNMMELQYGFPFPFVEQWSSLTPPDEVLPITVSIGTPGDNPTKIFRGKFILSYVVTVLVLTVVVMGVRLNERNF